MSRLRERFRQTGVGIACLAAVAAGPAGGAQDPAPLCPALEIGAAWSPETAEASGFWTFDKTMPVSETDLGDPRVQGSLGMTTSSLPDEVQAFTNGSA